MSCIGKSFFLSNFTYSAVKDNACNNLFLQPILVKIFSHLSFKELITASIACKEWHKISNEKSLGLKLFIEIMRHLVKATELKKMSTQEIHLYINISHRICKKTLNKYCEELPKLTRNSDEGNRSWDFAFKDLIKRTYNDSTSRSELFIGITRYRTLVLKKLMKGYFLKFIFLGAISKPPVRNIYTASHIVTQIKITRSTGPITNLEERLLIETQNTINSFVEEKIKKYKILSKQPRIIAQFKQDAYFGY